MGYGEFKEKQGAWIKENEIQKNNNNSFNFDSFTDGYRCFCFMELWF